MRSSQIGDGIKLDRDVAVTMRDGIRLMANVFRPADDRAAPVVMSVTPYGKDATPDWVFMTLMRLAGVRFGALDCSRWTGFEAPDPVFWVQAGFAVVQADVRGMHKSEGNAGVLTEDDAHDYYELIEWAAHQPWSTGRVGLVGVSYLAMSQWRVAALRPPSLKAIIPWEGVTDLLRELGYQDGVLETRFVGTWWRFRMKRGRNRRYAMAEDFPRERDARPLDDAWWAGKRPDLEAVDVPALVCASWSDHGLHTRGTLEGFERLGSSEKWLFTHGRRKWETFYSREARELQRRFFDRYLKGEANRWDDTPRVRLEVRESRNQSRTRAEHHWPLTSISYRPLYLDAVTGHLGPELPVQSGSATYRATGTRASDRATFAHRFAGETELTGSMTLKLWVSTSEGEDLDLFVLLRKFDRNGHEVCFYGYNGFDKDGVAKGWLRASHRQTDPARSRPGRPWHTHRQRQPLAPGQIEPVEIEVLASSTHFETGSILRLDVLGHDAAHYPGFRHRRTVNRGLHTIHTGGPFDSHLLVPYVIFDNKQVVAAF
jgi:putative CocE/NonD family hydrolase